MDFMTVTVIATSLLYAVSALEYVYRTWKGQCKPTPATWVLMFIAFSESVWLYWHTAEHSVAGNIGNIAGWINVCFIFCGVMSFYWLDGKLSVSFTPFQWECLKKGGWIIIAWIVTLAVGFPYGAEVAYCLTQLLALIAYRPTVKRLLTAEKSPEPITIWIAVFIACLCAIYPAVVKQDWKAWLYLFRAIPSAGYVIYLIHGLNVREAKQLRTV